MSRVLRWGEPAEARIESQIAILVDRRAPTHQRMAMNVKSAAPQRIWA